MIRTCCAACGTQLANTAPRCGNCSTPYCGRGCQKLHWKAGHKKECKQIELGGGAEQYYADKKCAEAVAVAVEKCADDTQGQTCYICTEALHWKTKEGLVRGCACGDREGVDSGTTGIAHVSCLAEQAKLSVAEAEENNLDGKRWSSRWKPWHTCSLCGQQYHGVVRCALGWACWKKYVGRPEADQARRYAITELGTGLSMAEHHADALPVRETELAMEQRLGASEECLLDVQSNLAKTYKELGRGEALHMQRDVYSRTLILYGEEAVDTLIEANNYAVCLVSLRHFEKARSLLRKTLPVARRVFGESHVSMLRMRGCYAEMLYRNDNATLDDLHEAVKTLENMERIARRVLGGAHPLTVDIEGDVKNARAALRAREEPSSGGP